jgi:hypothetical protein
MINQINGISESLLSLPPDSARSISSNSGATDFQKMLQSMLEPDSQGQVNEEQLYSAIINERITSSIGEEAAARYRSLFDENRMNMQRVDGYIPVEAAANSALDVMVADGLIDSSARESIKEQAFTAAQLDNNKNALYDSRGESIAVTLVNLAIESAEQAITGIENGTVVPGGEAAGNFQLADSSGEPGLFQGGDGFLFKPVSESNGNLVILLPSHLQGDVSGISLIDSTGMIIENGQSRGPYEDGRPLFRFDRPGGGYPDNLTVQVRLESGGVKEYTIPDSAKRWE